MGIELDGQPHFTPEGDEYDARRTQILELMKDIHIIRFENQDVFNHQENVLNFIRETVEERKKNIN